MMKRFAVVLMLVAFVFCAGVAFAADKLFEGKVSSVTAAVGKNGAEYARIILASEKEINGIKYDSGVPAMAFGPELVAQAKMFKSGDTIKLIGSERDYQGRTSITILKIVAQPGQQAKK